MRTLAIIPARGGSKGVPGKNIKNLGGKPLIQHAVDCAFNSLKVTTVVVTSDSDAILDKIIGDKIIKIKRPDDLAQDNSNVVTAVEHVLIGQADYDVIVLLQPTSPLRTSVQLDELLSKFEENSFLDGVISVVPMNDIHPARMYNLDDENQMHSYLQGGETLRRQDIKPVYYRNGCFYAVRKEAFLKEKTFMVKNKKAYIMDLNWLVNIDEPRDFKIAEILYDDWKNEVASNGM